MTTTNQGSADRSLLAGIDTDLAQNLVSRRGLFRAATAKLGAAASAPVVLAAASSQAFGQGIPQQIIDVLNFALTLEYLEDEFYRMGNASGVIPNQYREIFATIGRHETQHVAFLSSVLGGAAVAKPAFDFTAGGMYADVFSNFATFATLSRTFEDLGVGAYKGQATNLMASDQILTAALQIHSVEARHAAEVRRIQGMIPWDGGAFDEPIAKEDVLAAATPFIRM